MSNERQADIFGKLPVLVGSMAQADGSDSSTQRHEDHEQFDWSQDDSVVLREQPATAIYTNPRGEVVIRQECAWDEDEDRFIYLATQEAVLAVNEAIQREIGPNGHPNLAGLSSKRWAHA